MNHNFEIKVDVNVGGEWRTRARDGGSGEVGGDGSETAPMTTKKRKQKSTTDIGEKNWPIEM